MSFSPFRTFSWIFVGVCIGSFLSAFFGTYNDSKAVFHSSKDVFTSQKIEDSKELIQKEYYHFSEKSKTEIEDGMIAAMMNSLGDKHSTYFNSKEAKEFQEVLEGDFEGIGAVIDEHMKGIIIKKIFDTSPAKKAGLQDGDIITRVGSDSMVGIEVEDAVKKIRGPKGSSVVLTYLRGDEGEKQIEVIRDTIIIPSVVSTFLSGSQIGYLEVAYFGERTTEEFDKNFQNLVNSGAVSIVLDFRNNGGGYLDVAVDILSLLLPDGTLAVTTRENDPTKTQKLITKAQANTNTNIPLVMLINDLSASATEIVAGALQDHERAIIVGEKSYGKGSVQEPFLLDDGSMLKITIGRWYTPKDQNIDKNGITPDVMIPLFERDFTARYDRQLEGAKSTVQELLKNGATRTTVIEKLKQKDFTNE